MHQRDLPGQPIAYGLRPLLNASFASPLAATERQLTRRDPTYLALGDQTGQALSQGLLNYTLTSGNGTSLGLAWARLLPTAQQALTTISATLGQRLAGGAQLLVSASHARGQGRNSSRSIRTGTLSGAGAWPAVSR